MMEVFDQARDEIRLNKPIAESLSGHFRFTLPRIEQTTEAFPVDVLATNQHLVLSDKSLRTFTSVAPGDRRVPTVASIVHRYSPVAPSRLAVVLLCGGLSFRSGGHIHPLLTITDPITGKSRTLLDRQLDRLAASPLRDASCIVVGTPFNEDPLREILQRRPQGSQPHLCIAGLAPRLLPNQRPDGPLLLFRDKSGKVIYNPSGHFDALRWIVLSGMLNKLEQPEVLVLMNYSNWGRVFTEETLAIAAFAKESIAANPAALFVTEVVARHPEAERGSLLVTDADQTENLRLIKPTYGSDAPILANEREILLSTNTLYFPVSGVKTRLSKCAQTRFPMTAASATAITREQLAAIFETAFPVPPLLIPTPSPVQPQFLRMERDLDQLSLLSGPSPLRAVHAKANRGIFVKMPEDLRDADKIMALYS